jgi:ABC-type uncharacterized transport system YnjBCD ATPase subunit
MHKPHNLRIGCGTAASETAHGSESPVQGGYGGSMRRANLAAAIAVRFDEVDPFGLCGKELLNWRRRVQMGFQDPYGSLNARMTAGDIIAEPRRTHKTLYKTRRDRAARVRELLGLVDLRPSDADRYLQEFSGGQRQRIGTARALALNLGIIVCDEPVSGLDLSVQAQVLTRSTCSSGSRSHTSSFPRSVRGSACRRSCGRDVSRADRRNRPHRVGFRPAQSSLHGRADVGRAEAGRRARQPDSAEGRGAIAALSKTA